MDEIEAHILEGGTGFIKDPADILKLYDFSEIAKLFPITQLHIESILASESGRKAVELRFMEEAFDRDFWLNQGRETLGYKVARTLESQELESRYTGQSTMTPAEYADSRLLLCHDIYHLVMDFPMNPIGEVGLHAALFAQNRYPRAIPVIAGVLLSQKNNEGVEKVIKMCVDGYLRGMVMKNVFDVDWTPYLSQDLRTVRRTFNSKKA